MATVDDKKIIFSMVGLNKTIRQTNKQVLKNIYLSFFYGAKIGIIGLNGSGKSTLMKIIAGLDNQYEGQVVFSPGYTVGYLPQDPYLDPQKTVREIVEEGAAEAVNALKEYEEINLKFGDPEYYEDPDKMDKLMARQAELQDIIDATDAWNLDSKLEIAMDALRCPPADQLCDHLSGGERRRVALCRLLLQKPRNGLSPADFHHIVAIAAPLPVLPVFLVLDIDATHPQLAPGGIYHGIVGKARRIYLGADVVKRTRYYAQNVAAIRLVAAI